MSHINDATQQFRKIPAERFKNKIARTIGGIAIVIGAALLRKYDLLPERYATGAMVVGGLTASYEIVQAPLAYLLAFGKDAAAVIGKIKAAILNGKNGNGTPAP